MPVTKKILLIPNMPNWSLDKTARDIIKYNPTDIKIDKVYYIDFIKDWGKYHEEYDLLYPMMENLFSDFLIRGIPVDKTITMISSFVSWDKGKTFPPGYNTKPSGSTIRRFKKALLINTHCKKLWYIFSHYLPIIHTKYTCDIEMFYPEKKKKKNDKLIVGWTGSLTNTRFQKADDHFRGITNIIKAACDAVDGVELRTQIAEHSFIQDDNKMREFYNSLDLYACASRSEGTPMPVLEASACGIPSITVDVGIVPELVEDGVNGFVVERSTKAFIEKLSYIKENKEILFGMGKNICIRMETEFNWKNLIYQWTDFFHYAMELYQLKEEGAIHKP